MLSGMIKAADTGQKNRETDSLYRQIVSGSNDDSLSILYLKLGNNYVKQKKYDSAYKYYDLSLTVASETSDTLQLAEINKTIGSFYYESENYEQAHYYFSKSLGLYSDLNMAVGVASMNNNLGEYERYRGNYRGALDYYFSAIGINEEQNKFENLVINHNNIGLTYTHLNKFDSAFHHLKLAENLAEDPDFVRVQNNVLNSLGTYYMLLGEFDSAYYYLSKAYDISLHKNYTYQLKENALGLSRLYELTRNLDSAFFYYKIHKVYNDSIFNNRNLMQIESLIVKNKMESERRLERVELERREFLYLAVVVSVLLVMVIVVLLWINQRNKTRHSLLREEHLSLEKKYLKNEITSFALHISESNHLLEEISQTLKKIKVDQESMDDVTDLKVKLNTGLSNPQGRKLLDLKVNELHREFLKELSDKHPSLTQSELVLCSLMKLNLSSKEIASIKGVSPHAIKVARYRLRKKIDLSPDVTLSDYLNRL